MRTSARSQLETIKENEEKAVNAKIDDKDEDLDRADYVVEISFTVDSSSLCFYQSPYNGKT